MTINSMQQLYVEELRDLYSAEQMLVKALPKMAKGASSEELRMAIEEHLEMTEMHVERLMTIFEDLDEKPGGHTCKAMEGLVKEAEEKLKEVSEGPVRDAALIGAAQRVEHYEIAGYGTARTFARLLGYKEHEQTLQMTLDEEGQTDHKLTNLAEFVINDMAAAGSEQMMAESKDSRHKML